MKFNKLPIFLLIAIVVAIVCLLAYKWRLRKELDNICAVYAMKEQLFMQYPGSKQDPSEFAYRMAQEIEKNVWLPKVKNLFTVSGNVSPDERYKMFKTGAEDLVGAGWDCPAMKEFYSAPSASE
jgi:hypothetical protein